MSTFGFVCMGAPGHFLPTLAVAHELTARGDTVLYFIPERCRSHVEAAGAIWKPYVSGIIMGDSKRPKRRRGPELLQEAPIRFAQDTVAAMPHLVEQLTQHTPDVLICDSYAFAGQLAGEHLGIVTARFNPTYLLSDRLNYYRDPESGALLTGQEAMDRYHELMSPLFTRYGLPYQSFLGLRTRAAALDIVFISRNFHPYADQFGESVHFVGPSLLPAVRQLGQRTDICVAPYSGLIYISLGTVFSHDPMFYHLCIEALASLNVRVVMQVGEHFSDHLAGDIPASFVIRPPVAQLELLERADVFITHAGMGSTMESLYYGVPMLAIPQISEQMVTAKRIEELGAGLSLAREEISIATLRRCVLTLLHDQSFRRNAQALGEASRRDGGYVRACDRIQDLARSKSARL